MGNDVYSLRGPLPTGTVEGLKLDEVRTRLTSTSPEKVAAAGHAYSAAAGKLSAAQQELAQAIDYLGERWRGPAADEALAALKKLKATATTLAATSNQTGKAVQQYGEKILPWYKSHLPGDGFIHTGSDDEYAQKLMARLNSRITQTYNAVPEEMPVHLPGIGQGGSGSAATNLSGGGSAGDRGSHGVPLHPGADFSATASDAAPGGEQTGLRADPPQGATPGSDLASVSPGLDNSKGLGVVSGGQSSGATVSGASGGGIAPLSPGMGMRNPAVGGSGGGTSRGGRGNMASNKPRTSPMGQTGLGANVIGGLGGTGRPEEEERERSTWLAEDRDIWGDNAEESAPPVIGQLSTSACSEERSGHVRHVETQSAGEPEIPGTSDEFDEEEDLDLLLDELEAELDLEIAGLAKEDRGGL